MVEDIDAHLDEQQHGIVLVLSSSCGALGPLAEAAHEVKHSAGALVGGVEVRRAAVGQRVAREEPFVDARALDVVPLLQLRRRGSRGGDDPAGAHALGRRVRGGDAAGPAAREVEREEQHHRSGEKNQFHCGREWLR